MDFDAVVLEGLGRGRVLEKLRRSVLVIEAKSNSSLGTYLASTFATRTYSLTLAIAW